MTEEEFARFTRSFGKRVILANGVHWRQVRFCFYRPLLPYQEYPPQSVSGPAMARFGGFQHAVPPEVRTNSFLNLLICERPSAYSLSDLGGNPRREIKRAADIFTVSMITDVEEFKACAYPVYRSFYDRTKYEYKSERRNEVDFSKWADLLFQHPKVIVLGAYDKNRRLGAIGVWHLVEDTLVYSMFFCETEFLKRHVPGFMLHVMREAAAGCQSIKQIFLGNYKSSAARGVDNFYFLRGCKLIRKPAWLHINPLTGFCLQRFAPEQFDQLVGDIPVAGGGSEPKPGTSSVKPGARAVTAESKSAESGRSIQLPTAGPGSAGQN